MPRTTIFVGLRFEIVDIFLGRSGAATRPFFMAGAFSSELKSSGTTSSFAFRFHRSYLEMKAWKE